MIDVSYISMVHGRAGRRFVGAIRNFERQQKSGLKPLSLSR